MGYVTCLLIVYGGLFYKRENFYWIGVNFLIFFICILIYSFLSIFKLLLYLIFINVSKKIGYGLIILMYKNGYMVWLRL